MALTKFFSVACVLWGRTISYDMHVTVNIHMIWNNNFLGLVPTSCTHTYTLACMHSRAHTYMHSHIHTRTCMHACTHIFKILKEMSQVLSYKYLQVMYLWSSTLPMLLNNIVCGTSFIQTQTSVRKSITFKVVSVQYSVLFLSVSCSLGLPLQYILYSDFYSQLSS